MSTDDDQQPAAADDPTDAPVLTVDDVAQRWQCHPTSVREAIRAGRLSAFRVGKRTYRVLLVEVLRYEQRSSAPSGSSTDVTS